MVQRKLIPTYRTVTKAVESLEFIDKVPQFEIGSHVTIDYGVYEDHTFKIGDYRYNYDTKTFEYIYEFACMKMWYAESQLRKARL